MTYKMTDRERLTDALNEAKSAQQDYWNRLRILERLLGCDIEDGRDLSVVSADSLIKEFAPEVEE